MRKHLTTILLFVVMFAGLALVLYPPLADWWNSFHQSRAIASYTQAVDSGEKNDYTEYWEAARAYNEKLKKRDIVSRLNDKSLVDAEYSQLLNVDGSGILGIIEIPEIALTLPLYHGTDEAVLQVAVGHLEGTSLPTGGLGTHTAFSAHRGLPSAKLFTNLDQLERGDVFVLRVLDEILTYEIDQIQIVLPHQVESLAIREDQDYCSLITCTPYGVNSHRLIVRGKRTSNSTIAESIRITSEAMQIDPMIVAPIVAAPMLLVLLVIMLVNTSPKKKKSRAGMTLDEVNAQVAEMDQAESAKPDEHAAALLDEIAQRDAADEDEKGGERP